MWFNVDILLECGSPAGAAVAASAGLNGFIGSKTRIVLFNDTVDMLYLKRYGICETRYDVPDRGCGGSSRFKSFNPLWDVDLIRKAVKSPNVVPLAIVEQDDEDADEAAARRLEDGVSSENTRGRLYRMNVSKFKDKATAYAMLRASQRFLAFYTFSFPKGFDDDMAYKVLNSALTYCRSELGLKSYLWVMERQQNGTVHYHLLTNDFMNVRSVNDFVAGSIDFYVREYGQSWGNSSLSKYNGVDVKAIVRRGPLRRSKRPDEVVAKVIDYLSKYMSKQLQCASHRVWHCSRLVSALFTSCCVTADEMCIIGEECAKLGEEWRIVSMGEMRFMFFAAVRNSFWKETVCRLNERVWTYFEDHATW